MLESSWSTLMSKAFFILKDKIGTLFGCLCASFPHKRHNLRRRDLQLPVSEMCEKYGDKFSERILTSSEQQEYGNKADKAAYLAKRFAAKEAASKKRKNLINKIHCPSVLRKCFTSSDRAAILLRFYEKPRHDIATKKKLINKKKKTTKNTLLCKPTF